MRSELVKNVVNTLYEKNEREQLHCERVSSLCVALGEALNLSPERVNELKTVGLLHDIGKVGVDDKILNKSTPLTDVECGAIKQHPEIGFQILRSINEFVQVSEYALHHHERIDGKGYPQRLKGDEISLPTKIISIADSYDAMTSPRPYKNAMTKKEAIEEIRKNIGLQFDEHVANVFIEKVLEKK